MFPSFMSSSGFSALISLTRAITVTKRLDCVHLQEAQIDLCCGAINIGRFPEYSWVSTLQSEACGGGMRGKTRQ